MTFSSYTKLGDVLDFSQATPDHPQQIEPGDFNGDGKLDFLVTRNKGDGVPGTTYRFMMGQGSGLWLDQTTSMFTGAVPGTVYAPRVVVADLNGDGRSDVYIPDFGDHGPTGAGGFDQAWLSGPSGKLTVGYMAAIARRAHGVTWGDLDRDGDIDIMVNNVTSAFTAPTADLVLLNNGSGGFTDNQALLPSSLRTSNTARESHIWSLLADLTGDGSPDLVLGGWEQYLPNSTQKVNPPSRILINDGTGSFASSQILSLPKSPIVPDTTNDIDAVDLNGDGLNDLIISVTRDGDGSTGQYYGTGYLQILINQGGGRFVDETAARYPSQVANTPSAWWKFVRLTDFNKDGAPDLLVTGAGPNAFTTNQAAKLLLNDGTGRFSEMQVLPTTSASSTVHASTADTATLADVNGDGYMDVVTLQWTSPTALSLYALLNDYAPQRLTGSGAADTLTGGSGKDSLTGLAGNDTLDGGGGIDTAVFSGARAGYAVSRSATGHAVTSSAEGTDTLLNVERLKFSDVSLALDLSGHAGTTAKVLNAVFGREGLANKLYVGIGLQLLDAGTSYQALMQAALAARLGANASNTAVVTLLFANVVGSPPGAADLAFYKNMLDSGATSQAALGVLAANTALNTMKIDLTGLATTGIEYLPQG